MYLGMRNKYEKEGIKNDKEVIESEWLNQNIM